MILNSTDSNNDLLPLVTFSPTNSTISGTNNALVSRLPRRVLSYDDPSSRYSHGEGGREGTDIHRILLADVLPPDVVDGTPALAVDALGLLETDDDASERGVVL